jgi:hypothetical protein
MKPCVKPSPRNPQDTAYQRDGIFMPVLVHKAVLLSACLPGKVPRGFFWKIALLFNPTNLSSQSKNLASGLQQLLRRLLGSVGRSGLDPHVLAVCRDAQARRDIGHGVTARSTTCLTASLNSGANLCELMTNLLCSKDRSALYNEPGSVQTPKLGVNETGSRPAETFVGRTNTAPRRPRPITCCGASAAR